MAYLPGVTSIDTVPDSLAVAGQIRVGGIGFDADGGIGCLHVIALWEDNGDGGRDLIIGSTRGTLLADSEACSVAGVRGGSVGAFAYQEAVIYAQDSSDGPLTDLLYQGYNHGTSVYRVNKAGNGFFAGGLSAGIATKTGDYPVTDADSTIVIDASSKTITLPSAVTAGAGRIYVVVNGPSGATTTVATAAGTINGASTDTTLTTAYNRATFQSDGTNWIRIG